MNDRTSEALKQAEATLAAIEDELIVAQHNLAKYDEIKSHKKPKAADWNQTDCNERIQLLNNEIELIGRLRWAIQDVEKYRERIGDGKPHKYRLDGEVWMIANPSCAADDTIASTPFDALDRFAEEALAYAKTEEGGGWMLEDNVEINEGYYESADVYEVFPDGSEVLVLSGGKLVPQVEDKE